MKFEIVGGNRRNLRAVTPEEPALQARAPAFPGHAGGTGVAGEGSCGPGSVAKLVSVFFPKRPLTNQPKTFTNQPHFMRLSTIYL